MREKLALSAGAGRGLPRARRRGGAEGREITGRAGEARRGGAPDARLRPGDVIFFALRRRFQWGKGFPTRRRGESSHVNGGWSPPPVAADSRAGGAEKRRKSAPPAYGVACTHHRRRAFNEGDRHQQQIRGREG